MPAYAISQDEVKALATQIAEGVVKLIAVDYYWGAPVPGRYDTDFLRIWAVAQSDGSAGKVFLQGAGVNNDWSINTELQFQKTIKDSYGLFYLELGYQYEFPTQFVIRFDAGDGNQYYDNNGGYGRNYHLVPYHYRGVSAISGSDAIFLLPAISPVQLYWKTVRREA